ncbi:hypothetical protein Btru_068182 [Bulinus truncatus]|nr:hypothetical protein Btru_068182 [Bulinus truncatus]
MFGVTMCGPNPLVASRMFGVTMCGPNPLVASRMFGVTMCGPNPLVASQLAKRSAAIKMKKKIPARKFGRYYNQHMWQKITFMNNTEQEKLKVLV